MYLQRFSVVVSDENFLGVAGQSQPSNHLSLLVYVCLCVSTLPTLS